MRSARHFVWLLILVAVAAVGCQNGPFKTAGQTTPGQKQRDSYMAQLQVAKSRVSALDTNNQQLHIQIAQERQRNALFRQQLGDTTKLYNAEKMARQQSEKREAALQASTNYKGGAAISANNSLADSLKAIEMPGLEVRQDGDVIRIDLPSDKLFEPGKNILLPSAAPLLDQVADSIGRNYRKQRIGIEGHTDNASIAAPYSSNHQLAAAQASAVLERLATSNRLPYRQLHSLSHGANMPRFSNGAPAGRARNRRIELVVYPETFEK